MERKELIRELSALNPGINFILTSEDEIVFDVIGQVKDIKCPKGFNFVDRVGGKAISSKQQGGNYIELKMTASAKTREIYKKQTQPPKKEDTKKENNTYLSNAKTLFKEFLPIMGQKDGKTALVALKNEKTGQILNATEEQLASWSFMYGLTKMAFGKEDRQNQVKALYTDKLDKAYLILKTTVERADAENKPITTLFMSETAATLGATSNLNYDLARAMACADDYLKNGSPMQQENRKEVMKNYFTNYYRYLGREVNIQFGKTSNIEMV